MFGSLSDIDFQAVERAHVAPMAPSLQVEAEKAIRLAKVGTTAIVVLQAIAALSALGIFLLQAKAFSDSKKRRRSSKRRSKR